MQLVVVALIISIFTLDFFALQLSLIPRSITWLPEILSILTMLYVLARFGSSKSPLIPQKYKIFVALFLINIVVGVLINTVPPGALISGIRVYLKFLPFFLLPFVFQFNDKQIKTQLYLLLFFLLLQSPLAAYQRLFLHAGSLTGDVVRGTIGSSSVLTIILASSLAILMSFYLAKRIPAIYFLPMAVILFLPMTINETKSSLVFIPVAIFGPLFLANVKGKMKKALPVAVIGVIAMVSFVIIYDAFMRPRWGYGILDFLSMEGRAESYLYKGVDINNPIQKMGKVDSFILALRVLSDDFIGLFVGLGIGNASSSFLSGLDGEYFRQYAHLGVGTTALAQLIWETGVFGALLFYWLIYLVFKDASILRKQNSTMGAFAAGWGVVMIIMAIVIPYLNFIHENVIGYFFWYFSGLVAAKKYQWQLQGKRRTQVIQSVQEKVSNTSNSISNFNH